MSQIYTAEDFKGKSPAVNHIHWDGSIPVEDLFEYYSSNGKILLLPDKDLAGNAVTYNSRADRVIDSAKKLEEFQHGVLTKWSIADVFQIPIGAMKTGNDLLYRGIAHCEYLLSQEITYAETRFAPAYHINTNRQSSTGLFNLNEVIECALEGFKIGKDRTGVTVKPIICINREIDQEFIAGRSSVNSKDVVNAAIQYADKGVIGIDLACYEPLAPPDNFLTAYQLTFDTALKRTIHAGEMMKDEAANLRNIRYAVKNLRLDGISHAIPLYKDQRLVEVIAEQKIRIESNPCSNLHCQFITNVTELGLNRLVEAGVKVTINPDDPMMWPKGNLADNLALVANAYGPELADQMIYNAIETAWGLEELDKQQLIKKISR